MTYRVRNILIAVGLAVVAAVLTLFYVTNYKRDVQRQQETVGVLVAARDIPAGTPGSEIVAQDLLSLREVVRTAVVPGAVSSPDQIKQQIAIQAVYAGEQVTARRFGPVAVQGIRQQLTGTLRAFQVPGDRNQLLSGTLRSGDRIDVVASIKYKVSDVVAQGGSAGTASDVDRVASRVVLRDIKVLKTSGAAGAGTKLTSGPNDDHWVVLAVTDNQAQKLFFVLQNGDWSLQLRPALKAADSPGSVETIESVLGDGLRLGQFRQLYAGKQLR